MMEVKEGFETEKKERQVYSPGELGVAWTVFFPKYSNEGSLDRVKGDMALESAKDLLSRGVDVAMQTWAEKNNSVFLKEVENLQKEVKDRGWLGKFYEIPESEGSYSGDRRLGIEKLKAAGVKMIATGEAEKEDLWQEEMDVLYSKLKKGDKGVGVMGMDRGLMGFSRHPDSLKLPFYQFYGERHQNSAIFRNWKSAGFVDQGSMHTLDLLNGTRILRNEELKTDFDFKINPVDLSLLTYEYVDGYGEEDRKYKTDHYSAAVYHPVTLMVALGVEADQARVDYVHPEEQRDLEEKGPDKENFRKKRGNQRESIIAQNFDLVANILRWKEEGVWPEVLKEAVENKTPLGLKHYPKKKWKIEAGKLKKV